jgi:hypothetical protein
MLAFTDLFTGKGTAESSTLKVGEAVGTSKATAHGIAGIVMYKNKYACT